MQRHIQPRRTPGTARGMLQATVAMSTVGGAVTASTYLTEYPRYGAQAVRYGAAALVLAAVVRLVGRWRLHRPAGREWWWLIAAATSGMSGYNLAVVAALRHAQPTVVATIVSGVPIVLAIATPVVLRRRVPVGVVAAAVAVVAGAAVVQGGGRSDGAGIAVALVALAGECGFTLLGIPVLASLGPVSVATHTSWIAAVQLAVLAALVDGRGAVPVPSAEVALAIGYLVMASALAFALWFVAVSSIGGELAGLAAGVIPVAAVLTGVPLGVATLDARVALGTLLVACGVVAGVRGSRPVASGPARHRAQLDAGVDVHLAEVVNAAAALDGAQGCAAGATTME